RQTQPALRSVTVRSLRSTIRLLEQVLTKIEADSPKTPGSIDPNRPTPTTQPSLLEQLKPVFRQIGRAWAWLLKTIRSLLPQPQREKLSDTALSGIILGTVLLLLWINSAIKPAKAPPQIAARPAIEQPAETPIPDALPAPAEPTPASEPEAIEPPPAVEPDPVVITPEPSEPPEAIERELSDPPAIELEPIEPEAIESEPGESPVVIEPEPIEPPASIEESPVLEPEPEIAIEPPAPAPPPLTPEQTLIAAIQDQVGDLTNQYGNGLIQSIQANFRSSRLTVKVEEAWYDLSQSRQDQLAAEMLDRARSLDFNRLEITDPQGAIVARSPVVGSEMIILRRSMS
ncbi:MAG: hypothetical protein F6K28_44895, partial [Microcoleus sp. SIO2G3]|nr:hypothetical protein [Microcoleus sp. SIO2G3]